MPSVLTHYGFNKELYNKSIKFLEKNEDIYLLGAQGPDPFFFYGIIPFMGDKNGKEIRAFGNKLHKMDPSASFKFLFDYAKDKEEKDVLFAYILGAGLHYILDRKIHPYVFYKTGFSDDKKIKRKYFVDHTLFETNLDVLLMNGRYKDYKVKPSEAIKCDDDKVEEVSEMYEKLAKELLNYELDDDAFEDSHEHMEKIEKLLYSKKGIKKGIVNFLFKNTPFNTMMHPLCVKDDDKIDYLNLKKSEWKDPESEATYVKDFYDLIDEAKIDAKEWFSIVQDFYDGKNRDLKEFTKGFIYDGYLEGKKMKVFDSAFRKVKKIKSK